MTLPATEYLAAGHAIRTDWTRPEIAALFDLPFTELVFLAAQVHRVHHAADEIQRCTLLSIKTGGCPEDCGYCAQSVKADGAMFARLGLVAMAGEEPMRACAVEAVE